MAGADLHTHSTYSDGTETPASIVAEAARAGLDTIALSDHDTTAGWAEAARAGIEYGVRVLGALELSTRIAGASVHLLGYLPNPEHERLRQVIDEIRASRQTRARRIVENLSADYDFDWAEVERLVEPGATLGRPHIAQALLGRGYVASISEAFETLLHPRSGYLEAHHAPSPRDGVRLIREAGGVPVLAHPGTRGARRIGLADNLAELASAGLFGLEVDHPENQPDALAELRTLAERYGLAITGSSDFHGTRKPNRLGERTTATEVVDEIIRQGATDPLS